jgi:molybdopterin molybdotransferase
MPELFSLQTIEAALARLLTHVASLGRAERVAAADALGRTLAAPLRSPADLPAFARSAMDGFAVRAADTYGASEALPAYLALAGEVAMGRPPEVTMGPGQAARVHTGGMLPEGCDAVVMVEHTQQLDATLVEVLRPVAVGEHVIPRGDDMRAGAPLFAAGHLLRPQDLGALVGLGIVSVPVAARPRLAIVATGDELVPPERAPSPGQVRDINSTTLAALARQHGAEPLPRGIAPDHYAALLGVAERALADADALIISAGSSVSTRDLTARVIGDLGPPGVLVHGVAMHPGKPTILAICDGKPVFGLPGNPVSTMIAFELFVAAALRRMLGQTADGRPQTAGDNAFGSGQRLVRARLAQNVASHPGSDDFVPVRLARRDGELWAEPVFGKSNLISTLAHADGLLRVPLDAAGLLAGALVDVRLF